MSARRIRMIFPAAVAVALLLVPAGALADPSGMDKLSAVDSIAADVAIDGKDESKPATQTTASDSPSTQVYGGTGDKLPPPIDCGDAKDALGSGKAPVDTFSKPATDTSTKPATDTCTVVEACVDATDSKDAFGKDGKPACDVMTETETPVVTGTCVEGPAGKPSTTVCGGGGAPQQPVDEPFAAAPVAGGGEPMPIGTQVAGGGGPELPFTGLPLWYAIYGGLGLMILGGALWMRGRYGDKGAA
jgi:hypothetical protein